MVCRISFPKLTLSSLMLYYFLFVENSAEITTGTVKFANNIVDNYLNDCYAMKIRKTASPDFYYSALNIPVIDIDLGKPDYRRTLEHLTEAPRYSLMIKHNRQCIVYYMSLAGFTTFGPTYDLLSIFQIKVLQIEATFSYLVIAESSHYDTSVKFITSSKLKNFQHRLLVDVQRNEGESTVGKMHRMDLQSKELRFRLQRYCYFCLDGGNPGFMPDDKSYKLNQKFQGLTEIFPDMTKNFNGKTMRTTAPPAPPLVLITPSKTNPGKNEIQGQHANILISLAHHFNFTYTLYSSPGGLTGIKLPNGTWNGIMGEILYDRADIGLSVATSYERFQIVDVTVSVFYAFLVLVSTKPKPIFEWQAIFYPFQRNCWAAFIASTIFTYFASKWLHNNAIKYEIPNALRGKSQKEILARLKHEFMTGYMSFYITVGQLLEQGTPFDFNATPSRTYVIFWMFFAMIITTAYRSKLFTFLTFPTVEVPPSTFLELAKSTYKYGMKHLGGIAFVFITKSPLPYIRRVGEKMTVYNDKYSCLDRTFTDRFTCIIYKAYIDYMMEVRYWKVRHNFYLSDFVTPPVGSAWVLPKYAPWLPEFNRISFPIYEMGLADKYLYDYQVHIAKFLRARAKATNSTKDIFDINSNYKGDDDGGPKPLEMGNMYASFFILIFGTIIASISLVMEVMRKNKLQRRVRERQLRFRIYLRRLVKQRKRELPPGRRNLTLHQVAMIVLPNSNNIRELT